jgi:acetyl esterase/lipase
MGARSRMRGISAVALIGALLLLVTVHEATANGDAEASQAREARAGHRYHALVFDDVSVTRDIPYAQVVDHAGNARTLHLDIYEPADDTNTRRPVALWLHQGGFTEGDKTQMERYAVDFAKRGYVSVAINYRLRPEMDWFDLDERPAAAADADADALTAIAWLRTHASRYGLDPTLIFASGYSAGGVMAFDLAYPPNGGISPIIAAVPISGYATKPDHPGGASVLAYHGPDDLMIRPTWAQLSCAAAQRVLNQCTVDMIPGSGHEIGLTKFTEITDGAAAFFARQLVDRGVARSLS